MISGKSRPGNGLAMRQLEEERRRHLGSARRTTRISLLAVDGLGGDGSRGSAVAKAIVPAPLERWLRVRDEIYTDIYQNFWNADLRPFVQHKGAQTVDASSLLMPLVKFSGPTDPRWLSTLQAIEKSLVEDSLVYRYNIGDAASDGLSGKEGTFNMCSFWFVECLSRAGDLEKARFFLKRRLATPITSAFIRRNSVQAVSISEIFRRRSPIWR